MTKLKFLICAILATVIVMVEMPSVAANVSTQIQMLDSNIRKLEIEKREKMAELEKCARGVNGFRIAGISTLGLTAVGIGVNISQASKKSNLNRQIDAKEAEIERRQQEIAALARQEAVRDAELARLQEDMAELQHQLAECKKDGTCDTDADEDDAPVVIPEKIEIEEDEIVISPVKPDTKPTPKKECIDGRTQQCTVDSKRGTQTCINGKWGDCIAAAECEEGRAYSCSMGLVGGIEVYGTKTCKDGKFGNCLCTNGNSMACANGGRARCIDGKWGECEAECVDGTTMGCGKNQIKRCINGKWGNCEYVKSQSQICADNGGQYSDNGRQAECFFRNVAGGKAGCDAKCSGIFEFVPNTYYQAGSFMTDSLCHCYLRQVETVHR